MSLCGVEPPHLAAPARQFAQVYSDGTACGHVGHNRGSIRGSGGHERVQPSQLPQPFGDDFMPLIRNQQVPGARGEKPLRGN